MGTADILLERALTEKELHRHLEDLVQRGRYEAAVPVSYAAADERGPIPVDIMPVRHVQQHDYSLLRSSESGALYLVNFYALLGRHAKIERFSPGAEAEPGKLLLCFQQREGTSLLRPVAGEASGHLTMTFRPSFLERTIDSDIHPLGYTATDDLRDPLFSSIYRKAESKTLGDRFATVADSLRERYNRAQDLTVLPYTAE